MPWFFLMKKFTFCLRKSHDAQNLWKLGVSYHCISIYGLKTDITGSKLNLKNLNCVKSVRKRGVSGPHFIFVNLILSSEKMGQKKYYLCAIFT